MNKILQSEKKTYFMKGVDPGSGNVLPGGKERDLFFPVPDYMRFFVEDPAYITDIKPVHLPFF